MKRILHLTHTDIKTDARVLKEMGALLKVDYNVNGLGIQLIEGAAESKITFDAKIEAIKLHSRKLDFFPRTVRHFFSLFELLVKMVPTAIRLKPELVHCHDTLVLPIGAILKLVTGCKLIYDAHELESDRNGLTKLQGKLTLYTEKFLWRFIDALIVVSPSIEKWYLANLGNKKSTVILNSPLFDDVNISGGSYLRDKFNIPTENLIFLYIGILGKGRGLENLVKAFSNESVRSHIVFLGFGELSSYLKEISELNDKFHLHDAVPHSQVVPIAMSASFGLCLIENISLSDYLCLPNKLFEYCFAGIPVLASDFPDIKKIINDYCVGECCGFDDISIVEAIKKMEIQSKTYFTRDLSLLSWQQQEKKLIDLYKSILN